MSVPHTPHEGNFGAQPQPGQPYPPEPYSGQPYAGQPYAGQPHAGQSHHAVSETKASTKTSELYVYLAAVAAVIITALLVGEDNNSHVDPFGALDALRYITYLTIGYMIARGLAKSGSRDNHHDN